LLRERGRRERRGSREGVVGAKTHASQKVKRADERSLRKSDGKQKTLFAKRQKSLFEKERKQTKKEREKVLLFLDGVSSRVFDSASASSRVERKSDARCNRAGRGDGGSGFRAAAAAAS
jgi:hypothetical protein